MPVYKHTHPSRCVCTLGYVVLDSHKLRVLSSLTITMGDSLSQKVKDLLNDTTLKVPVDGPNCTLTFLVKTDFD